MESWMVARALKPSLRAEIWAMKPTEQVVKDELWSLNCVLSGEDFSVESFLDLSNGGFEEVPVQGDEEGEDEEEDGSVLSSQEQADDDASSNSGSLSFDTCLNDELILPDDVAGLEWVSHFVDDSPFPELSHAVPERNAKTEFPVKSRLEPKAAGPGFLKKPCFSLPVPAKPRTKRARISHTDQVRLLGKTMEKELERKGEVVQTNGVLGVKLFQRSCSHCGTQTTPQWRSGPEGAKTLCNACGVRYKSGRLFPEYRPAGSPTFSGNIHSNSHRKVLALRKRKELT